MKALTYIGCTICGVPRDEDVFPAPHFSPHVHLWAELQLVQGWDSEEEAAA